MRPAQNGDSKILNVDDNDGARYVKTRILTRAGFDVLECENGGDALSIAREKLPALILLDVKLPDINGMEVCRRLKADPLTQHILILQTSASFVGTADKIRALDYGADNYLMEPIDPEELVANVKALLRLGRVERELREVDRRKDEFIATLAHELRNPLAPIKNAVEVWSRMEPHLSPDLLKVRDAIRRQTNHLAHLVDDLLDVSRVSSGKIVLRWEPVTLKDVVDTAVETALPVIEKRGHRLNIEVPAVDVWILGDHVRLAQVLSNLLLNAAKFTNPGGKIFLLAGVIDGSLKIQVRDNGIGISSAEMHKIFDLFSQSNRSPDQTQEGLGIGLALVRALITLHGGKVTAQSDGVGCGSTFELCLPVAEQPGQVAVAPAMVDTEVVVKRVLIVDDNEDAATTLAQLLELNGHQVSMAFSGRDAIKCVMNSQPHIIFLDIGLPDMTGYDLALALRELPFGRDATLIALTGYGQDQDRRAAEAAGFDHHFVKPMDLKCLGPLGLVSD